MGRGGQRPHQGAGSLRRPHQGAGPLRRPHRGPHLEHHWRERIQNRAELERRPAGARRPRKVVATADRSTTPCSKSGIYSKINLSIYLSINLLQPRVNDQISVKFSSFVHLFVFAIFLPFSCVFFLWPSLERGKKLS